MNKIIAILFIVVSVVSFGVYFSVNLPTMFYDRLVKNEIKNDYYYMKKYRHDLFKHSTFKIEVGDKDVAENTWKKFHLGDVLIPLPVRHPLYLTVPILDDALNTKTKFGIKLVGHDSREIIKILFLPNSRFSLRQRDLKFFEIPIVKKILESKSYEKIWDDLFTLEIPKHFKEFKNFELAAYYMYILYLRSEFFPNDMITFGRITDTNKYLIRVESTNKDYRNDIIMFRHNDQVLSYLVRTNVLYDKSILLKSRFLRDITFQESSKSMAKLYYGEFKTLPFFRKKDQEGMVYLLSAWSHDIGNKGYLREMIQMLERGENNYTQLKPLYEYSLKHFGQTFSSKEYGSEFEDPEVRLKKKIEAEDRRLIEEARILKSKVIELSDEEKLQLRLKRAKERRSKKKNNDRQYID
jgi:hypothetical protein